MLMRTDPFRELDRLTQQLFGATPARGAMVMPMDAYRRDDWFYIHFDLPGVDPDSIDVTVEQNVLTVHARRPAIDAAELVVAERPVGTFTRQIFLGDTLDVDKLDADYNAGVLTVRLPILEQAKPRHVEITRSRDRKEIT
jgi:HSP20 family protein